MSEKDAKKGKDSKDAKPKQQAQGGAPKQPKQAKGKQGQQESKAAAVELDDKPSGPAAPARLQVVYKEQVTKDLTQQFGYKSPMEVPRIEKIVLNMGVGEAVADKKILDNAV